MSLAINNAAIFKIRIIFYFLGFFLIHLWHFIYSYGTSVFYEIISTIFFTPSNLCDVLPKELILKFFDSVFVFPLCSTLFIFIFERIYFKELNKYGIVFHWLPVILILASIISCSFSIDLLGLGMYSEIWIYSLVLIVQLPILVAKWKKSISYFLGIALIFSADFIQRNFGSITPDQILSSILLGRSGIFVLSSDLVRSFIKEIFILPLMISGLILNFQKWIVNNAHLNPRFMNYGHIIIQSILITVGIVYLGVAIDLLAIIKYYKMPQESVKDLFAEKYVDPSKLQFTAIQPKSLIYIYVESLETTYQNPKLFGHNLLQPLTDLKQSNISFQKYKQTNGAQWTLAGFVATQCGIPLKLITTLSSNDIGASLSQFLPRAICLSDILNKFEYQNIFMNGVALSFSGLDHFLKSHHYTEIFGKDEWLRHGFNSLDMIGWGLPDDLLFQQAKLKVEQLVNNKKPFNLTILTIDTHGFHGQLNKSCHTRGARDFKDIVACTAYEVVDFINYIESKGWMDNIVIVVTGDHLAMGNEVQSKLNTNPSRYIFNMIISNSLIKKNRETIFHVDLFPTVVESLGIQWPGDQLGLGYSAIAPLKPVSSSKERFNSIEHIVASHSTRYNQLWKPIVQRKHPKN